MTGEQQLQTAERKPLSMQALITTEIMHLIIFKNKGEMFFVFRKQKTELSIKDVH